MKFSTSTARNFGWKGIKGWAYLMNKKSSMSCAYIIVTGRHGKIKNTKSARLYFVIEGVGQFNVNNEVVKVRKNDVILIQKNSPYDYKGKMKMFLVDNPPLDLKTDIKLE